jgi:hypothetical protein
MKLNLSLGAAFLMALGPASLFAETYDVKGVWADRADVNVNGARDGTLTILESEDGGKQVEWAFVVEQPDGSQTSMERSLFFEASEGPWFLVKDGDIVIGKGHCGRVLKWCSFRVKEDEVVWGETWEVDGEGPIHIAGFRKSADQTIDWKGQGGLMSSL